MDIIAGRTGNADVLQFHGCFSVSGSSLVMYRNSSRIRHKHPVYLALTYGADYCITHSKRYMRALVHLSFFVL